FSKVKKANWTDITDRLSFPKRANTYTDAGTVDLSDLAVVGKPFYFAFRYVNELTEEGNPVRWYVLSPEWRSLTPEGKEVIGTMTATENTMGFHVVHQNPYEPG